MKSKKNMYIAIALIVICLVTLIGVSVYLSSKDSENGGKDEWHTKYELDPSNTGNMIDYSGITQENDL